MVVECCWGYAVPTSLSQGGRSTFGWAKDFSWKWYSSTKQERHTAPATTSNRPTTLSALGQRSAMSSFCPMLPPPFTQHNRASSNARNCSENLLKFLHVLKPFSSLRSWPCFLPCLFAHLLHLYRPGSSFYVSTAAPSCYYWGLMDQLATDQLGVHVHDNAVVIVLLQMSFTQVGPTQGCSSSQASMPILLWFPIQFI